MLNLLSLGENKCIFSESNTTLISNAGFVSQSSFNDFKEDVKIQKLVIERALFIWSETLSPLLSIRYVSQRCPLAAARDPTRSSSPWTQSLKTERYEYNGHRAASIPLRNRRVRWSAFTRRIMPVSTPKVHPLGKSLLNSAVTPAPVLWVSCVYFLFHLICDNELRD